MLTWVYAAVLRRTHLYLYADESGFAFGDVFMLAPVFDAGVNVSVHLSPSFRVALGVP